MGGEEMKFMRGRVGVDGSSAGWVGMDEELDGDGRDGWKFCGMGGMDEELDGDGRGWMEVMWDGWGWMRNWTRMGGDGCNFYHRVGLYFPT